MVTSRSRLRRKCLLDAALRKLGHHLPPMVLFAGGRVDRAYQRVVTAAGLLPSNVLVHDRFGNVFRVFKQPLVTVSNSVDFYLYYFGVWEPLMTYAVRRLVRPGQVCLDGGANVGWYTVLLASLVGPGGHVHAFEPDPETAAQLEEHVLLNHAVSTCSVNRAALGRTRGGGRNMYRTENALYSSLYPLGHPADRGHETRATQSVFTESIDAYARSHGIAAIDFLKLDVEGSEFDVFKGAADFLGGAPRLPVIQLEVNPARAAAAGFKPESMLEWLQQQWGYTWYHVTLTGALARIPELGVAAASLREIFCMPPDRTVC